MSDTPETDKEWSKWLHKLKIPIESFVDFARKLERERDAAREAFAIATSNCVDAHQRLREMEDQRDEAWEKAERYRLEANAMMAKLHELHEPGEAK